MIQDPDRVDNRLSAFAKSEQRQPEYLAINPKERVRRVSAMHALRVRARARA